MKPASPEAYKLIHEGALALTEVERAGFRVDIKKLDANIQIIKDKIAGLTNKLKQDDIYKRWQRKFGQNTNFNSRDQLSKILYGEMGYTPASVTAGRAGGHSDEFDGRASADEAALEKLGLPFTRDYLEIAKLDKLYRTYLLGIRREVEGDRVHPFFSLNRVLTYRGACGDPNLQNIPIRVEAIAKIIRECFVSTDADHRIIELDFSGIEVCVAACYHKDPTMLRYIREGYDMHRDMAVECYRLPAIKHWATDAQKKNLKAARQQAKALFVFAQFYGDWYISCAQSLWEAIDRHHLKGLDGEPLYARDENNVPYGSLVDAGIECLGDLDPKREQPGTFVQHLKEVEARFWNERFPIYNKWRKAWFDAYQRQGYFHTLTGFLVQGVYDRNFVINCPVQGSAFHVLLWSMTEMVKWLIKNKMKSKVVCQIHDSMIGDVHKDEEQDFLGKAKEIMTVDVFKRFPWIVTPMKVEAEAAPYGGSWHEKKGIEF